MTARRREIAWPLFFLFAFLLTLPLLGWTLADGPIVDDNPLLFAAQLDSTAKLKFLLMPDVGVYWRPLGKLTVVPAATLFGYATWPHRLTILLLHALATTLLFALARRLINQRAALLTALLFFVHPAHAGTLHWLSARFDLVATVFVLGGALSFARYVREGRGRSLVWATLWTLAACLSKEIAFVAPPLYATLIFFSAQRPPLKRTIVGLLATGSPVAAVLVARMMLLGGLGGPARLHDPLPGVIVGNLFRHVPRTLFAPLNRAALPAGWADALQVPLLIAAGVFLFYLFLRRGRLDAWRGVVFGVLAALPMAPFLYLGPHLNAGYMLYLPSVGFAWWLGESTFGEGHTPVTPLWRRLKFAAVGVFLALGAPLLLVNLAAHHGASQTVEKIVRAATRDIDPARAHTILFEDLPTQARGIRLYYDHVDQLFLPQRAFADKRLLLVGDNFWRTEGENLPWRDATWRAGVRVARWQPSAALSDATDLTRGAWEQRSSLTDDPTALAFSGRVPPHVQSVSGGLQWTDGPIDAELIAPAEPPNTPRLRFRLTTEDPAAFKEAALVWRDDEGREHRAMFDVLDDDRPHDYALPLAVDPRWARTNAPTALRLHLPFRRGKIVFTE
ncbi:MAG TPA: glycosyltransferase family 39 protein [bacterium]|nr:glycosyltransferase family 39 protein [bacterium]